MYINGKIFLLLTIIAESILIWCILALSYYFYNIAFTGFILLLTCGMVGFIIPWIVFNYTEKVFKKMNLFIELDRRDFEYNTKIKWLKTNKIWHMTPFEEYKICLFSKSSMLAFKLRFC